MIRNLSDLTRQQIVAQELGQLRALGLVRRQASLKLSEGILQRAKAATEVEPASTEPLPAATGVAASIIGNLQSCVVKTPT